jgi:hypothetical protein
MDWDDEQRPELPHQNLTTNAESMVAFSNTLTELVDRMEAELAEAGTITDESAGELRSLRVQAELFFGAHAGTARDA